MFYRGTQTFPHWNGNDFISGVGTQSLNRMIIRDVGEGPDGSLWMLEDANPGPVTLNIRY